MTFWVSTFDDLTAASIHGEEMSLDELGDRIGTTTAQVKDKLPSLKLARFGPSRSQLGSLRHDANVVSVAGCEGDYDGEQMAFTSAVQRLQAANFNFIAHTSPSNTLAAPGGESSRRSHRSLRRQSAPRWSTA
jgi:hypothetical protein